MESSIEEYVANFVTTEDDVFTGVLPTLYKISDREINGVIELYRRMVEIEDVTNEELRPIVVNTIIYLRA